MEIILDNKNGKLWDLSQVISGASWKTVRIGAGATFEFTLVDRGIYQYKDFAINNGDIIRVNVDGVNVFLGYIFDISEGMDEAVKIKAYDQIRYLQANESFVFKNRTADFIIKKVASEFGLKVGDIPATGYVIPKMVQDNKKALDTVYMGLDLTLINSGRNFVFFDDFGKLSIRNIVDWKLDFVIGDNSLLTDYDYKRSIDDETYNKIKIVQNNKKTGKRDVYIAQDSNNMVKWGTLQLYQVADEKMNAAQINKSLSELAKLHNRERKSLSVEARGDVRVRAGCSVPIFIDRIGLKVYFVVDEVTHSWSGADHKMKLKLVVI
ncbi:MAG: hypothetical protein ABS894_00655 [Aerococcus urinaeequi]